MVFNARLLSSFVMGAFIVVAIGCDNDGDPEPELYEGTLTIMQKDAYSDAPGRSTQLWPPHTTVVLDWSGKAGSASGHAIQLNHGTEPGAVNSQGETLLTVAKVYSFTGTQSQMEELQIAFEAAVCDDADSKFLDLASAETVLSNTLIKEMADYIFNDGDFACGGLVNKDSIIAFLEAGDVHKVMAELSNCTWTKGDWLIAFEAALGKVVDDLGHGLVQYHVCNNDAAMQVDLIKAYIATGEVTPMAGNCSGPEWYYVPD
jgi:hypothetical protein